MHAVTRHCHALMWCAPRTPTWAGYTNRWRAAATTPWPSCRSAGPWLSRLQLLLRQAKLRPWSRGGDIRRVVVVWTGGLDDLAAAEASRGAGAACQTVLDTQRLAAAVAGMWMACARVACPFTPLRTRPGTLACHAGWCCRRVSACVVAAIARLLNMPVRVACVLSQAMAHVTVQHEAQPAQYTSIAPNTTRSAAFVGSELEPGTREGGRKILLGRLPVQSRQARPNTQRTRTKMSSRGAGGSWAAALARGAARATCTPALRRAGALLAGGLSCVGAEAARP